MTGLVGPMAVEGVPDGKAGVFGVELVMLHAHGKWGEENLTMEGHAG